ncbi:DUF1294 domain-containing protein [Chitinimonas naiadis]
MTALLSGLLLAGALLDMLWRQPPWQSLVGLYTAQSLLALVAYAWDKQAAQRQASRIPERSLLLVGLLGGWPGALLAQRLVHHKTGKASFQWRFWLSVALNLAALLLVLVRPVLYTPFPSPP